MIDSLEEISGCMGTFRERLRMARTDRTDEVPHMVAVVQELQARFETRQAELA